MIIGLSGQAGVGKDTIGARLVEIYGFKRTALADPLKRICKDVFDFSYEQCYGPSAKRNEPDKRYPRNRPYRLEVTDGDGNTDAVWGMRVDYLTPREALQKLGTEFGRSCYENVWVDMAIREANVALAEDPITGKPRAKGVVITDVRFKNEVEGLRALGAKVVRIKRDVPTLPGQGSVHVSETEMKSIPDSAFDYVLDNNKPLDDMDSQIIDMMNSFRCTDLKPRH